jgi:hypothetical protein
MTLPWELTYAIHGVLLVFQTVTVGWLLLIGLTDRGQRLPLGHRASLAVVALGLLWSAVHNVHFIVTGEPWANGLPEARYLTEVGLFMLTFKTMLMVADKRITLNNPTATDCPAPVRDKRTGRFTKRHKAKP